MRELLAQMVVGEQVDVSKTTVAVRQWLCRLKREAGWQRRYRIRIWGPGKTRIWRIE